MERTSEQDHDQAGEEESSQSQVKRHKRTTAAGKPSTGADSEIISKEEGESARIPRQVRAACDGAGRRRPRVVNRLLTG